MNFFPTGWTVSHRSLCFFAVLLVVLACLTVPAYAAAPDATPGFWDGLLEWVKGVFVPGEDYFPNQMQRLNALVKEKLGGIGVLYKTLQHAFSSLSNASASTGLVFSLPDDCFYQGFDGFSVDMLSHGAPYIKLLRDLFSVFLLLITAIACYKKAVSFFSE